MTRQIRKALIPFGISCAFVAAACSGEGAGTGAPDTNGSATPDADETMLPTAPESQRVDLEPPVFSDPTTVDNPLFPISGLHSALLLGNVEGHPLRIETTLLPDHKVIDLDGEEIETLASQFVAYLDGRIHEVALDWYGQSDDGSVWYFGEDVFNYEDGVVADTDGTWLAGADGPVAMIMPADPQVGDVYRPENIPDSIFEEVTVTSIGLTVNGPRGPVDGAMVGQELHLLEGYYEDKIFAPGYGEFVSGVDGSLETLAIAVPTDALSDPLPPDLQVLTDGAIAVVDAVEADDWPAAAATLDEMRIAWSTYGEGRQVPENLAIQMDRAMDALAGDALSPAVDARNGIGASNAALDLLQAGLDLQLQYRPPVEIDRERFVGWTRQLVVDVGGAEPEPGNIAGDITTLEWIWDRIAYTFDDGGDVEALLDDLRTAADEENAEAAADAATDLFQLVGRNRLQS